MIVALQILAQGRELAEEQAEKARAVITGVEKALVVDAVLVETVWVLDGRRYRIDKDRIIAVVDALLRDSNLCFEDAAVVWTALVDYEHSERADFADCLIVNKARRHTEDRGLQFNGVYTFDRGAQELDGMFDLPQAKL